MERTFASEQFRTIDDSQWLAGDSTGMTSCLASLSDEKASRADHLNTLGNGSVPPSNILSALDTTPASPANSIFSEHQLVSPLSQVSISPRVSAKHQRYPLKDLQLESFVLNSDFFLLQLKQQIGVGGSAYVYDCVLNIINDPHVNFELAVKIPLGKSRAASIVKEAKFALKLKEYINSGSWNGGDDFPFVECLGLYYLNKESFPLFKRNDELPCLILRKMDTNLHDYIRTQKTCRKQEELKLERKMWWSLCHTLLNSLKVLKDLYSVHCDYKTENVLVKYADDGVTLSFKVIDFSSVSSVDSTGEMPDLTYIFSAPELLKYDTKERPNYQTDLFSVGLILLHAATGSLPYPQASHDQFYQLMAAQEGKPLDWISAEDKVVLKENSCEASLISKILLDRCTLADALSYTSHRL